jgi:hypothetical protein
MERNKSNKDVRQPKSDFYVHHVKYTGDLIDKLFLDEDRDNVLLELDEHVRDMTPDYLRKEKLLY